MVYEQDFRTEGEVRTQRGYGGNDETKMDKVRMVYYRAKTVLTVPSGAEKKKNKHTSLFSYCHKVSHIVPSFQLQSLR